MTSAPTTPTPGWREGVWIVVCLSLTFYVLTHRVGAASVYLDNVSTVTNMMPVVTVERDWILGMGPGAVVVTTYNYPHAPRSDTFPPSTNAPPLEFRVKQTGSERKTYYCWCVQGVCYTIPAEVKIRSTTTNALSATKIKEN